MLCWCNKEQYPLPLCFEDCVSLVHDPVWYKPRRVGGQWCQLAWIAKQSATQSASSKHRVGCTQQSICRIHAVIVMLNAHRSVCSNANSDAALVMHSHLHVHLKHGML
eukprot:scaffold13054_cov19-Tisochrysis_lutea.AAC.1